jgi:hypothetical protein
MELTGGSDRFRGRADFEGERQGSLLGNGQPDAALNAGREALERCARLVPSGCQPRHREVALCVADGAPRQAGVKIGDDDVDAWQDAASSSLIVPEMVAVVICATAGEVIVGRRTRTTRATISLLTPPCHGRQEANNSIRRPTLSRTCLYSGSACSSRRGGEALMCQGQPLPQLVGGFIGRRSVKRHHCGRHARTPSELRPPPVTDAGHFDLVGAPADGVFEMMNLHVCDVWLE